METTNITSEVVLRRIDAIIDELQQLRQMLQQERSSATEVGLAHQLYGSLGQGSWDEYDPDLDWKRFDS